MKQYLISAVIALIVAGAVGWAFLSMHSQPLGATSTLDNVDSPYVTISGVHTAYKAVSMAATSSVACAIQNPLGATSTLDAFGGQINSNGLVSAQTFDVSTSSNAFGSSTPALMYAVSVGAGAQSTFAWARATTTNTQVIGAAVAANGSTAVIVGPTQWVTLRIATGTPGVFTSYLAGKCSAIFRSFN